MAQLTFNSLNEVLQFADAVRNQGNVTLQPWKPNYQRDMETWARSQYEDARYFSESKVEFLYMRDMELHHLLNALAKVVSEHRKNAEEYEVVHALAWHVNQRLVASIYDEL